MEDEAKIKYTDMTSITIAKWLEQIISNGQQGNYDVIEEIIADDPPTLALNLTNGQTFIIAVEEHQK